MNHFTHRISGLQLSLVAGATLLTACGREDGRENGRTSAQNADRTVASAERRADDMAVDARKGMGSAADAVANKSKDIAITTEVKARLARDEKLSALAINVDTDSGRVVLRGSAPDTAARSHATELARAVDGVVKVDNELNVQRGN